MEIRHYLAFEFKGLDERFVYIVSEEVKKYVTGTLLEGDWRIAGPVVEFDDVGGRMIAVNARYICRCQGLYDAGVYPPSEEDEEDQPDMIIAVDGMRAPLIYRDIAPDDAALVASVVSGVETEEALFVSFLDEDGEQNLIPADKVMLLESIHYDLEDEDEVLVGVAAVEPPKKRSSTRARKASAK